ncbi:hypothetical protein CN140_26055 [Sinorhizobium meliloti]|nr:hypothetical protein CDO25_31245 [Sinorhizobium meliloti]RVH69463.1 hypothetical protein CN203_33385 [Sinorhizobium meliloti]RVL66554.1 hypothetical protein CN137_05050 [Sinorhizobium meliloti]RVL77411.1 hypothetical protein CN140_26055 [Sinorhizobium meliloti]RVN49479.1 hypothetical protein CN108_31750 [Sinorhizobium meliloti]
MLTSSRIRFIGAPVALGLPIAKLPRASDRLLSSRTQQCTSHLKLLRRPLFRWTGTTDHRLRRDSVQR